MMNDEEIKSKKKTGSERMKSTIKDIQMGIDLDIIWEKARALRDKINEMLDAFEADTGHNFVPRISRNLVIGNIVPSVSVYIDTIELSDNSSAIPLKVEEE